MISALALDVAHLFAGGLVLVSVMLLYQDRMTGLISTFALHALVVSLSVAWQAYIQQAPHLYITAAIALVIKAVVIPPNVPHGARTLDSSCVEIDVFHPPRRGVLEAMGITPEA